MAFLKLKAMKKPAGGPVQRFSSDIFLCETLPLVCSQGGCKDGSHSNISNVIKCLFAQVERSFVSNMIPSMKGYVLVLPVDL